MVTLPQNNQVRSNVRRITVSTNFDGVTEIQVKQKLLDCWWLESNIREAHKIKWLFSKFPFKISIFEQPSKKSARTVYI